MKSKLFALVVAISAAFAAPAMAKVDTALFAPQNGHAVIDQANVIDDATEADLNKKLADFSRDTERQMVIITVPTLHGHTVEEFTGDYARYLAIGSAELDDGVVYLVAVKDRKQRLEVGKGLGDALTDIDSGRIQNLAKTPFRKGDYSGGISAVTAIVLDKITPTTERRKADEGARASQRKVKSQGSAEHVLSWIGIGVSILGMLIGAGFLATIPKRRRARQKAAFKELLAGCSRSGQRAREGHAILTNMPKTKKKEMFGDLYDEAALRIAILQGDGELLLKLENTTAGERYVALKQAPGMILRVSNPTIQEMTAAVSANPRLIAQMKNPPEDVVLAALARDGMWISKVKDATSEMRAVAIASAPMAITLVDKPTKEEWLKALAGDGELIARIPNPTIEMRRAALSSKASAIRHIANPTTDEINAILARDPDNVRFVLDKIPPQKLAEIVTLRPSTIRLIQDPNSDLQMTAVQRDPSVIEYIERPTRQVQAIAVSRDVRLALVIKNPSHETREVVAQIKAEEARRLAREAEERRQREARRRAQEAEERRQREEQDRIDSTAIGFGSVGSSVDTNSFSGGGGTFDGGGASSDW